MGGGGGRKGILRSVSSPVVSRGEGSFDKLRTNGEMGGGRTEMGGGWADTQPGQKGNGGHRRPLPNPGAHVLRSC